MNSNFEIYGGSFEALPILEIDLHESGMPDEIMRIVTFSHNQITMPENPDLDRYVQIKIDYSLGSNNKEIIYYNNNLHTLVNQSADVLLNVDIHEDVIAEVWISNNTYTEFTGSLGVGKIVTSGDVYINHTSFSDSTNFGTTLFDFDNGKTVNIDNFVITNVATEEGAIGSFFHSDSTNYIDVIVNNLTVSSTDINEYSIVNLEGKTNKFIFTNSNLVEVTIGMDNHMIYLHNINTVYIDTVTLNNIYEDHDQYEDSYMIRIDFLNLNSTEDSLIQNINIDNAFISFFELDHLTGTTSEPREFLIKNIVFSNTKFTHSFDLILGSEIITSEDFQITIKNFTFEDINFVMGGNLIYLSSQLLNSFIVTDLHINNVTGGGIYIEAYNKQSPIKAKMTLTNITTEYVNLEYRSLITLAEGSEIEIHNSLIQDMTSFEEGAVIHAKGPSAVATIYDCQFENNTAYQGALFWIESFSVVKVYDSQFYNNFAVQASITYSTSEGYFEFYNTSIYENYAISSPIALIFDTSSTSLLNNGQIHDNVILTKSEFLAEINTKCRYLCFIIPEYKTYINTHIDLLDIVVSEYGFQTIRGTLSLTNQTSIYSQSDLVDSVFVSELIIDDVIFTNISLTDHHIKLTESIASITNSSVSYMSLANSTYHAFLSANTESSVSFRDFNYINNAASFADILQSVITIDGAVISNVTGDYYVFKVDQS